MSNSDYLSYLGLQPLYRLINKEKLNSNLIASENGKIPFKKGSV